MNDKVKLGIAVFVGIVGGGLLSTLGGGPEVSKNTLLGSGYNNGSITVVTTQQGGSNGDAKVVLRLVT